MKKIIFVVFLGLGILSGCKKDNVSVPYTPSCNGTEKSYQTDVLPVIESSCSGCHQNLNSYSQLFVLRNSVRSMVASGQMPQGSSLSTAQKDAIVCWIDSGAPNN